MGIRLKILLAFLVCFGLMAGVSLSLLERSVSQSYDAIERDDIVANMARVERSFEASATSLKSQTNDWAVWNDMYRYALNPDPEWAKESIGDDALAPADLTLAMILAKDGRVLNVSTIQHEGARLSVLTPAMSAYLDQIRKDTRQTQCGIIRIEAGLMLTCWAGIVQSDASGEVAGMVIMGRLLDSQRLLKLREQIKLPFELKDQPNVPEGLTRWSGLLEQGIIGSGDFWASSAPDVYHLVYPLQDILGQNLGLITLDVPRSVHQQGLMLYQQVRQQLGLTVVVVTILLGLALHFILIRRLRRLARQIDVLESQSAWDARIEIGGADELGLVASKFNALLTLIRSQLDGLKDLLGAKESAIKLIQATQGQLMLSEKAAWLGRQRVSDLLNNSGQGFMSFGGDLIVDPEVSRACATLLGCQAAGRNVVQLLLSDDPARAELFGETIHAVLAESDPGIRESMLTLLPAEISRNGLLLNANYTLLENGKFMVILTDITEERRLAAMLQSERRRLEFIVAAVTDTRNFFDAIDGFREFIAHSLAPQLMENATPQSLTSWLYRRVHTCKGLLNQFNFVHTPAVLHDMETRLSGLISQGDALTRQSIIEVVSPHSLQSPFDKDLAVLSDALGAQFLDSARSIHLSGDQAAQIERLAERLLQGKAVDTSAKELRDFLSEIVCLRKLSFETALKSFDGLVQQAATRLEKNVASIEVDGGSELWIDPQTYQAFLHSLGHVFRNAVVHGLETPEDRWAVGKNETGRIMCRVTQDEYTIKLSIADDGAGIDLAAVRRQAAIAGLYTDAEARELSDDEIATLIFREQISTLDTATELSGRGFGLAAVRIEVEKLGGTIEINTVAGQGTEFLFTLPWRHGKPGQDGDRATTLELVMQSIIDQTRGYFESEHATVLTDLGSATGTLESLELLDLTAAIGMGDRIAFQVAFSFQDSLADAVYGWMTAGFNDHPDDVEKHREAAVGEVANTILGHCTNVFQPPSSQGISMTPPLILGRTAQFPAIENAAFRIAHLTTALGRLDIIVIGPRESISTAAPYAK